MDWYYTINRERFGPSSAYIVKNLIATGKLKKDDLVWTESMGDAWKKVVDEFPELLPCNTGMNPIPHDEINGTGGKLPNDHITADARAALSGRWGTAIGGLIIYIIIAGLAATIPFIGILLVIPLVLGVMDFFLSISRQEDAEIGQIFSGFKRFGPAVGAYLMVGIFMILWMIPGLLIMCTGMAFVPDFEIVQQLPRLPFYLPEATGLALVIGGAFLLYLTMIITSLRYSQVYFVLTDDPDSGPISSIHTSCELMKGNKWKFFCLGFRFLGWFILSMLTFGIGLIWIYPYMMTAYARFYDDLKL